MSDYVYSGIDSALRAFGSLHVSFDFAPALRRLADGQLDIVDRVAPGLTVDTEFYRPRTE
jgi:hypothetical protein